MLVNPIQVITSVLCKMLALVSLTATFYFPLVSPMLCCSSSSIEKSELCFLAFISDIFRHYLLFVSFFSGLKLRVYRFFFFFFTIFVPIKHCANAQKKEKHRAKWIELREKCVFVFKKKWWTKINKNKRESMHTRNYLFINYCLLSFYLLLLPIARCFNFCFDFGMQKKMLHFSSLCFHPSSMFNVRWNEINIAIWTEQMRMNWLKKMH